jgi:hypothetical protein
MPTHESRSLLLLLLLLCLLLLVLLLRVLLLRVLLRLLLSLPGCCILLLLCMLLLREGPGCAVRALLLLLSWLLLVREGGGSWPLSPTLALSISPRLGSVECCLRHHAAAPAPAVPGLCTEVCKVPWAAREEQNRTMLTLRTTRPPRFS